MAEITRKVLSLTFTNDFGKNLTLTINDPIDNAEGSVVTSVMDEIIAAGCFGVESVAANKVSAQYIIQQKDEIELA